MEKIIFILACYIFTISVSPCTDLVCQNINSEGLEIAHEHTADHDHSKDSGEDHCPPFCTCNCCGISIKLSEVSNQALFFQVQNYYYQYFYSFDYKHHYQQSIWEPPAFV